MDQLALTSVTITANSLLCPSVSNFWQSNLAAPTEVMKFIV